MASTPPLVAALSTSSTAPPPAALLVLSRYNRLPVVIEVEAIFRAVPVVRVSQFHTCAKFALAMVWPAAAVRLDNGGVPPLPRVVQLVPSQPEKMPPVYLSIPALVELQDG